jgi:serine/threonine-protein kinase
MAAGPVEDITPTSSMSAEARTIGRYRIIERVGRDVLGILYRGVDPALDREVAIKVMAADFESEEDAEEARTRFFNEANAAARLQHPNIVTILECAEDAGVPYTVTEFLRGQCLPARLASGPPLSLPEKIFVVSELCAGLQFAHDNDVVHRGVKPANVWLLDDGTVKLVDFAIVKLLSSTLTHQGEVLDSAYYMAPEQVLGTIVDGRADIFSRQLHSPVVFNDRIDTEADDWAQFTAPAGIRTNQTLPFSCPLAATISSNGPQ